MLLSLIGAPTVLAQAISSGESTSNSVGKSIYLPLFASSNTQGSAAVRAADTTFIDSQANDPQMEGDAGLNATAVFSLKAVKSDTIAVNPINPNYLIGGSDEQRQPPCGPGTVRGATTANGSLILPQCRYVRHLHFE
ncbi:MAG: hypothetical protein R2911_02450 [Caldilineaceae bacterium]